MVLTPLTARYPTLRRGYVVELKYLKRGDGGGSGERADELANSALEAAKEQLGRYLADERLARQHPSVLFTGIALVFRGWELVRAEPIDTARAH